MRRWRSTVDEIKNSRMASLRGFRHMKRSKRRGRSFVKPAVMHTGANQDMREGARWYDERRAGLGEEFLALVDQALYAIEENSETGVAVNGQFRMKMLPRYPYGVVFRERSTCIHIVAVHHHSRDSGYWVQRDEELDEQ